MARRQISERCFKADQSWNYEWTGEIGKQKFQVRIRRNAYDFQSYARVLIYDPRSSQWNPIVDAPIDECDCSAVSYVHSKVEAARFHKDRDRLLNEAIDITTLPPEVEEIIPIEDDGRPPKPHQV